MSRNGPGARRGPRVIAGEAGGLRLVAPRGQRTRPTADRVKESLFAALGADRIADVEVLDCFAGSGALAIEALSRGARQAVLVDRDPQAVDAIRRNLRTTGLTERARVVRRGVTTFLRAGAAEGGGPVGLVFLDPPYDLPAAELGAVLALLDTGGWVGADGVVVVERPAAAGAPAVPDGWSVTWERTYGGTLVVLTGPRP
jgi:16S rRNA (guanine966-N2)-methyltransferase